MEVFMLAWLSKDPLLLELCNTSDVYLALYEKIIGKKVDENSREMAKKFFLPVIYGQSSYGLGKRLGVSTDVSNEIVSRINASFPVALSFIEESHKQLVENGYAKNIFGKRRYFQEGEEYLVKNF